MATKKPVGVRKAARAVVAIEAAAGVGVAGVALAAGAPVLGALAAVAGLGLGARALGLGALAALAAKESKHEGQPWPKLGAAKWTSFFTRGALYAARAQWYELTWSPKADLDREIQRAASSKGPLVVLVPGYACDAGPLARWAKAMEDSGMAVARFEYANALGSIDQHASELSDFVGKAMAATGKTPWIAGHSMGGLIAIRAVLGGMPCLGILTVGTPLEGTRRSEAGKGEAMAQMKLGSAWLAELKQKWVAGSDTPLRCIWSSCDPIVSPNTSASGAGWGAEASRRWDGVGHLEQIGSRSGARDAAKEMAAFIGAPRFDRPT